MAMKLHSNKRSTSWVGLIVFGAFSFVMLCSITPYAQELPGVTGALPGSPVEEQHNPDNSSEENAAKAVKDENLQPEPQKFPELNQVIPMSAEVTAKLTALSTKIEQKEIIKTIDAKFVKLEEQLKELQAQFSDIQNIENWPLNRLLAADARYTEINEVLSELIKPLSATLTRLEEIRIEWTQKQKFWSDWKQALSDSGSEIPEETFQKTLQDIAGILKKLSAASTEILKFEEPYSEAQEALTRRLVLIDETLASRRKAVLERDAYSLLNSEFYNQFSVRILNEYRRNFFSILHIPESFWNRQGWVVGLHLFATISLAVILVYRRQKPEPVSEEWEFLFKHPIAGAFFITMAVVGGFYDNIPPAWKWLLLAIATISGSILVVANTEKAHRKRFIKILALIFLLLGTLKITGFPMPAYQLLVALICIFAAPISLYMARYRQRQGPDYSRFHVTSLYLLGASAIVTLIAALLGYFTLSVNIVDGVLGTIIILLMVGIAIKLSDGGIKEFLKRETVRKSRLIFCLGTSTARRLKNLARVIIYIQAFLSVLVIWNIFKNVDEAVKKILEIEFTFGEVSISVSILVTLAVVLYLTRIITWFLEGFADSQYMTPRNMELGIKTATKRLMHYALFTIGFFVAVSMAGLELERLTIIAGALSVGIGFGLQNIVNNFVSGLILLFERPVKVGDIINIEGQWGTITKIGLRSTVFETFDKAEVIVPNSDLVAQKVTNWTFTTSVSRIVLPVGVAYGSPLDKVLEILNRAAKEHPNVLDEPDVSALFKGFGESSLDFELRAWVTDINTRLQVTSELGQAIDRYFREEGIEIPFPQRDLHLRSIESNLQGLFKSPTSKSGE